MTDVFEAKLLDASGSGETVRIIGAGNFGRGPWRWLPGGQRIDDDICESAGA